MSFLRKIISKLVFHYQQLFAAEVWNIGILERPIQTLLQNDIETEEINWMPKPKSGEYRADPFAFCKKDGLQIFYEHYNYRSRSGKISSIEFNNKEWGLNPSIEIEELYHISYPYLIKYGNSVYCIPETAENNQVVLCRLNEKDNQFKHEKTILERTRACDSTIFHHNGYWWLFCTLKENPNSKLFVYYSEHFLGPYSPHQKNPVKEDIRSSRPAGTPFYDKDILYRPAQDCSESYGKRISINRIMKLSPETFEELVVKVIEMPSDSLYNQGIHTIAAAGDYTLIDAKRYTFIWDNFIFQLKRKIKKLLKIS